MSSDHPCPELSLWFFTTVVFLFLVSSSVSGATLPPEEVKALQDIAVTMGQKNSYFGVVPCTEERGWITTTGGHDGVKNLTCNCSYSNGAVCHVTSIILEGQDLQGRLPPEIVRLPYLQELDLNDNYLSGSIPGEWGSTQLLTIKLSENRISGHIPSALGNISTLTVLTMESNELSGILPSELGNLTNIEIMMLNSNNLSGELPATFSKLVKLTEFWISDNEFKGQIPNFIQNWTNLKKLFIQSSGLNGPIPSEISNLTKLEDLRITDINGTFDSFPPLRNMSKMQILILRSCNINGLLPDYLDQMKNLTVLDLSFNKLSGEIPQSYSSLQNVNYIYLTGNMLTGPIPSGILRSKKNIDLSYNNFARNSTDSGCYGPHQGVNLFASSSMENNSIGTGSCPRSLSCSRTSYSFHINCGGEKATDGSTVYDADEDRLGPSRFALASKGAWALSNTGHFMDGSSGQSDDYLAINASSLSMTNTQLYTQARLSPISLTYYGFCLGNGNYTVSLHFAEIIFTNRSLGRRIFDVYIQRQRVLKDFNIEENAGGVGRAVTKNFTASVTHETLEIRFHWAGKGTNDLPTRGVYGPLISAISVNPNFKPPTEPSRIAMVVGMVASAAFIVGAVLVLLWWKGCLRSTSPLGKVLVLLWRKGCLRSTSTLGKVLVLLWRKGCLRSTSTLDTDLQGLGNFSIRQIKSATNNFDPANKIGEGGFGSVYKGCLSNGTAIAVKMLSAKSKQGNREFVNEIGIISAQQHPNLVKLFGCCTDRGQLLLVYEYLQNNNLARALYGSEKHQLKLDWPTRQRICVGIARGIAYLHEESKVKIVHRDIKSTNVLLDKDLNPKISDFGLARLNEEENTHISTRVAGTLGYLAPEYAMQGYCTDKVDVYSFGIVALEIVSGRSNTTCQPGEQPLYLLDLAHALKEEGNLKELVDPRLGSDYNEEEAMVMIKVAILCTDESPKRRPSMSAVVSMLERYIPVEESVMDSSASLAADIDKLEELKKHYQFSCSKEHSENGNLQSESNSRHDRCTSSSISGVDLYPLVLDSEYCDTRN